MPRLLVLVTMAGFFGLHRLEAKLAVPEQRAAIEQLRPGMNTDEVRKLMHEPQQLARQILHRQYFEEWTYSSPPVQVLFRAELGRVPEIVTVRPLPPGRQ
jgi:hypothetical protein